MKRFKNVLVVYDDAVGGDDALGQAVALARENAAHLTIATVLRETQRPAGIANETKKRLDRLATGACQSGVPEVRAKVLVGNPFQAIIGRVIADRHDLIITSAEAGKLLRGVFFGGTAVNLMRHCPCPVWVLKAGQTIPYSRILAAVDPRPGLEEDQLNKKIMDLATSLASRDHAELQIVTAWEVEGKDGDTLKSELSARERSAILERHEREIRSLLQDLLAPYPLSDIEHRMHLPRGLPAKAICDLAMRDQVDLIVMGTVGRAGLSGFLLGSTAEAVLGSVTCSVLTVKPDGFHSSVVSLDALGVA